jgi:hypothetical protein
MILLFLSCNRLMTVKTVHALPGVHAHLVFMNNRVLSSEMTFRTFPAGANKVRGRLFGFGFWPGSVDEECRHDESKGDHDAQEHGSKRHGTSG